jgi:hypothetical protein
MQDRAIEAGGLGRGGFGVQRIVVAAQAVDQRHLRARAEIADGVRRARRHRMRRRRLARRPAEAAIAAAENRLRDRRDPVRRSPCR